MVGHRTMIKPSRSDEVLDADQQLQISNQVREHFDSVAPKRPTKPNRSDPNSTSESSICTENFSVPEFQKFQSLQSQSQVMFTGPNTQEQEEFVETQYYKELDSIDKQHYATGSGFIKAVSEKGEHEYDLQLPRGEENINGGYRKMVFKTNPATNDWIPSLEDDQVVYVSAKPNRSESG